MIEKISGLTTGFLTTIVAQIHDVGFWKTALFAFIGGAMGWLGQHAIKLLVKQLKKLFTHEKNS